MEHRVNLTPLSRADSDALFGWINDREQVLFNSPYRPVHRPQHDAWFESILKRHDVALFGIRTVADGRLIGTCQLTDIHPLHRGAELRIRIGVPQDRGQGHGAEACRLLLAFGFRDLNLHRIWLQVFDDNEPALKLYRKLGFLEEGRQRQAAFVDGRFKSIVLMSMLREEYRE